MVLQARLPLLGVVAEAAAMAVEGRTAARARYEDTWHMQVLDGGVPQGCKV